jgi:hypothetical protein
MAISWEPVFLAELAMPVVLRYKGYSFFFFSNEGSPRERAHIHVRQGRATAKFWLTPEISLTRSDGMSARELHELAGVIRDNRDLVLKAWKEFFNE